MNSKQWMKVQVIKSSMTIKPTKKIYNTKSEGLQMMGGKPTNYQILNKKGIDALIAQGYKMFGTVEASKVVDLTGEPSVEAQILLYEYNKNMKEKNRRDIENFLKPVNFKKSDKIDFSKYFERYYKNMKIERVN